MIKSRAAELREKGHMALAKQLPTYVGTTVDVLVEQTTEGRTPHYAPVRLTPPGTPGEIVPVHILSADAGLLHGQAIT